jgi:hypothetical protein
MLVPYDPGPYPNKPLLNACLSTNMCAGLPSEGKMSRCPRTVRQTARCHLQEGCTFSVYRASSFQLGCLAKDSNSDFSVCSTDCPAAHRHGLASQQHCSFMQNAPIAAPWPDAANFRVNSSASPV